MEMNMPMQPVGTGFPMGGFGGFGGNGSEWFIFLIFIMLFGYGGNGFGGNGRFTGGEIFGDQFVLQDLKNNQRAIDSNVRDIDMGLCNLRYDSALQGSQTRDTIMTSAFGLERQLSNLGMDLSNYNCQTNRNIDNVKYDMARGFCDVVNSAEMNTRDIITNQNSNTQRIIDMMTQNEIAKLRDEKLALQGELSQARQTSTIINTLRPTPIPSYVVPTPAVV